MGRLDFKRLLVLFIIVIIVQYAATWVLALLGIGGLVALAIIDFVVAFSFMFFQIPRDMRRYALKTQTFHYNVLTYFAVLFVITLIQWIL
jgi:uncharacterized membrane protein